jgi:hypothetical protein
MIKAAVVAAAVGFGSVVAVGQKQPFNPGYQQQNPLQQQQTPTTTSSNSLLEGAQMQRSQFFNAAIPPSFNVAIESQNEIFVVSQQAHAMYGVMGWAGLRTVSNMQGLAQLCCKCLAGDAQMQNFRVLGTQPAQAAQGFAQAVDFQFTYTLPSGGQFVGEGLINIGRGQNGLVIGAMRFFATTQEQFTQLRPQLARLAQSISGNNPRTFATNANVRVARPAAGGAVGGAPGAAPTASLNHPNDGSDIMQQYEQDQRVQDQLSLQRSDTMRDQNRYVGPDGTEYTAPLEATQVTVDNTGQATYTTEQAPTPPANETVAQPYDYSAPAPAASE